MAKDYKGLAETIISLTGGKENITHALHCATRLRLNLRDYAKVKTDEIKALDGVLGVQKVGEQLQVIIGPDVDKVYDEVIAATGLEAGAAIEENLDNAEKKPLTLKTIGGSILDALSGSLGPVIPAIVACAFFKMLTSILGPDILNVLPTDSNLYTLFTFVGDAAFYFFPVICAMFSIARR